MLHNHCLLGGPQTRGQNQKWLPHPTFLGTHKWVEVLHNPCILGGPQTSGQNQKWLPHPCLLGGPKEGGIATQPLHSLGSPNKGTKSKPGAAPLPSGGRASGRKCYVTPAFSGGPETRGPNRNWPPHASLLGGPKEGGSATQPLHSRGSPNKGTQSQVAASPVPSRGPKRGRKCYITTAFSAVPKQGDKIRSGCLTVPSWGPTSGRKCYATTAFSGVPKQGDKIRTGCPTPAFSWVRKWAEVLRNPCILRGSRNKGTKSKLAASRLPSWGPTSGWKCYVTPAFSGVPKKGDKIRSGCLTLAFLEANMWADLLRNICVLGGPQTRGQNQNGLPHPCLLGGPQVGGSAT